VTWNLQSRLGAAGRFLEGDLQVVAQVGAALRAAAAAATTQDVAEATKALGYPNRATDVADVTFIGAAIAIGALMPASIMAIACGNLFTRNIYKDFINPNCSPQSEARMAKIVAFAAKLGALFFVLELQTTYAIQLQLLGGLWICQTVPAVLLALYVRLDPRALLAGWATGVGLGTWMVASLAFKSSTYPLHIFGLTVPCYAAVSALLANLAVSWLLTVILRATVGVQQADETVAADYV